MKTNKLNHHLNLIAADLLELAANEVQAHNPRTYYFPDTPELREWLIRHQILFEKSDAKGQLLAFDFRIMAALAKHFLQREAENNE